MSTRLQGALVLIAVFLLGAVAGGGIATARSARSMGRLYDAPPIARQQRSVVATLEREVDLDAEQERRVESIVASFEAEQQAIRREMKPRVAAMRARLYEDLRGVMRPDQQAAFQKFVRKAENRAKRRDP